MLPLRFSHLTVAAVLLLPAAPALAQDVSSGPVRLGDMPPGLIRLSEVMGTAVIGSDIRRLGEVKELWIGRDGMVGAVEIGVGGVLGMGEKSVAVPFGAMLWNFEARPTDLPSSSNTGVLPSGSQAVPAQSAEATRPGPAAEEVTGTVGDPGQPEEGLRSKGATVPVTGDGAIARAVLRGATRDSVRNAPAFRY